MKKLLFSITKKDFDIQWFSGSGAGGQHRNKHQNCCRLIHKESGLMAIGQDQRSQKDNLTNAFKRLVNKQEFQNWLKIKSSGKVLDEHEIENKIDQEMKNIKVEYLEQEEWIDETKKMAEKTTEEVSEVY